MLTITNHAYDRRKRTGLNKKAFERLAEKALELGVKHSETSGRFRRLFTSLYFKEKCANNIRVYGDFIWLFANETLITVLHLNNSFKKYV